MTSARLRWGDEVPNDPDLARGRLLDAAESCFSRFGIGKTTIEDVAKEAQVSRATVYRYFSGRDAVVSGVILRATERYLEKMRPRVEAQSDLASAILEFVEVTLRAARRDEIIGLLFTSDEGLDAGGILGSTSVALFELIEDFFSPIFAERSEQLRPDVTLEDGSEWILRAVLSLLTVSGPKRRSQPGLDAYLRRYLLPALIRSDLV